LLCVMNKECGFGSFVSGVVGVSVGFAKVCTRRYDL
jgi:hypothetical protein